MDTTQLLLDAYGRIGEEVHRATAGLRPEHVTARPDPRANSIGWLLWHLTRIQDDHVAEVARRPQVYAQGWRARLGLPYGETDTGYGHGTQEVASFPQAAPEELVAYYDAVADSTLSWLRTLSAADLDRVVDQRWDPPVTLGVRLLSVLSDDLQHCGQVAYVRGLLEQGFRYR